MFQPSLVLLSVLCVGKAIAMPHQAMNLARDSDIISLYQPDINDEQVAGPTNGSTSTTSGLPNSPPSAMSTGTTSTSIAGVPAPNTSSTSVAGGAQPTGAQPTGHSTTTSNPPQGASSTLTTHSTHSVGHPTGIPGGPIIPTHPTQGRPTITMSGGNAVETLVVRPGEWEILAVWEENKSKDTMFVEIHRSTRYGSGGGKGIQTGIPGAGGHGNATSVTRTHTRSAGGQGRPTPVISTGGAGSQATSTSVIATGGAGSKATSTSSVPLPSPLTPGSASTDKNLNVNSKINVGSSSTLCTDHETKTKTAPAGNTVF